MMIVGDLAVSAVVHFDTSMDCQVYCFACGMIVLVHTHVDGVAAAADIVRVLVHNWLHGDSCDFVAVAGGA